MTRYVIIGAGAIGGGVAGLLADAGADVVAVARGRHAEVIRQQGLRVRLPDRQFTVRLPCVSDPAELTLGPDDVLVLTVKTQQAPQALRQWTDVPVHGPGNEDGTYEVGRAGDLLPVLTALNGVSAEDMALRYFARVVGVSVWMPAVHLQPGEVIVRAVRPTRGTFHVGRYPAGEGEETLLDAVARDWDPAGLQVISAPDVMRWKYRKLISNVGNAFEALVGSRDRIGPLVKAAQAEARQVLAAAGIAMVDDATEAAARADSVELGEVPGQPEELGGSSWQSLTRGTGTIETDYLNGEIVRLAHLAGVAAPINTGVAVLARQAAESGQPPGAIGADELARRLGLDPAEQ